MAPLLPYYDVSVHYGELVFTINHLDPDRYSRLDLIDDIWEYALTSIPPSVGVCVKMYYKIGTVRWDIDTDYDLLEMFEIVGKPNVDIFVEVINLDCPSEATTAGPPPPQFYEFEGEGEGEGEGQQPQAATLLLLEEACSSAPMPESGGGAGRGVIVPEAGVDCNRLPVLEAGGDCNRLPVPEPGVDCSKDPVPEAGGDCNRLPVPEPGVDCSKDPVPEAGGDCGRFPVTEAGGDCNRLPVPEPCVDCSKDPVPEAGGDCGRVPVPESGTEGEDFPASNSDDESFFEDSGTDDSVDSDDVSLYSEHGSDESSGRNCREEDSGDGYRGSFNSDKDSFNATVDSGLNGKHGKKTTGVIYVEKKRTAYYIREMNDV